MTFDPKTMQELERHGRQVEREAGRADLSAILGDGQGRILLPGNSRWYYYRQVSTNSAGDTVYSAPSIALASGATIPEEEGIPIRITFWGRTPVVAGIDPIRYGEITGKTAAALNPLSAYNKQVLMRYAVLGYAVPVATSDTQTIEVYVHPFNYVNDDGIYKVAGNAKIDLTSNIPAVDGDGNNQQRLCAVFVSKDNAFIQVVSTPKLASDTLTHDVDVAEVFANAPARAMPIRVWKLTTGMSILTIGDEFADIRGWLNTIRRKNNFIATIDPTVNDDIDLGYEIGSTWINITTDTVWRCFNSADGVALWLELSAGVAGAWNGTALVNFDLTVTEAGGVITGNLEKTGTGDIDVRFSTGRFTIDTTPAATVTLTAGTATVPQINHIYIPITTKLLTAKTSTYLEDWPSGEHVPIAIVILRTAAITQTDGAFGNQNINNRPENEASNDQGWIQIVGNHLRSLGPKWITGVTPTITIVTNGGAADDVFFANTSGLIRQFNFQTFPALDMQVSDDIHIANRSGAAYTTVSNLNGELSDSTGTSMSGKYFWLTFWGIVNKAGEVSHILCNLPNASYNTQANALADVNGTKVRDIPTDWDNTGFLISETLFRHQPAASGTWTEIQSKTLLILTGGFGGGAIVDPITSFSDAVFDWFNSTDPTKIVDVDLSGLATATTRTLTMPDDDGTIALVGASKIKKHVIIKPDAVKLGGTPPTQAVIGNFSVLQFTNAATETIYTSFHVPTDWDTATDITFSVRWAPADANAGDVVWQMTYAPIAVENNELISAAGTTISITDSTQTLQDELLESGDMTIAAASLALGDEIGLAFFRDPAHGSDTYASNASFVSLHIEYTSDKLGEAV